jgi:ribose transport system permease protein
MTLPAARNPCRALLGDAGRDVVLGGANLTGGHGTILGTVVGAALIEIIRRSLTLLGISTFGQGNFVGTFIVVAVAFDSVRRGRRNSIA